MGCFKDFIALDLNFVIKPLMLLHTAFQYFIDNLELISLNQ